MTHPTHGGRAVAAEPYRVAQTTAPHPTTLSPAHTPS